MAIWPIFEHVESTKQHFFLHFWFPKENGLAYIETDEEKFKLIRGLVGKVWNWIKITAPAFMNLRSEAEITRDRLIHHISKVIQNCRKGFRWILLLPNVLPNTGNNSRTWKLWSRCWPMFPWKVSVTTVLMRISFWTSITVMPNYGQEYL